MQRRSDIAEPEATGEAPRPEDCLAGGGDMGALMRSVDWSRTDFGPVSAWPQSLRTAVSIMLESRFAMVVAWGPDFRFFYNDRYRPVLGKTKHPSALGTPAREIFPEIWGVIEPEFERVRGGDAFAIDDWLLPLDRNGYLENCYFTLSYSPIRDESGGVGGMLAVVVETTGRVEGERRLATLRELARRAADAKTPIEACRNAAAVLGRNPIDVPFALLYLIDEDDHTARFVTGIGLPCDHPVCPETIDLAPDPTPGIWPFARVATTGRSEVVDLLDRFGGLPGGPFPEPSRSAIVLGLARPGHDRPYGFLVAGVSPRRAIDDRYRGFFDLTADHIATAISNARAFEEERLRAEALAELDRAKTAFFSNVSHEFRTPLTLMLGPIEDALASPDRALGGAALESVNRNALRLLRLVNTLLDFSRIEAGRAEASYEPTDLASLTRDVASGFRSMIEGAGLRFVVDLPRLSEPAFVDHVLWEKIVLNLLSNAFKFTFEGTITVALREESDRFALTVSDTGTGIPETELPNIFRRFHRVAGARSRTHEGSGIGLALVHEVVRMHGGDIRVTSAAGSGTTFQVTLPKGTSHLPSERVNARSSPAESPDVARPFYEEAQLWAPADSPPTPSAGATGTECVLVVDDNADMRAYLERVLGSRWTVETASDGAAALESARARRPDLVLTDVMMPVRDGFQLLAALREDEGMRHVPVILLSARAGEEARADGLDAGADDYLVKPFSARELVARVATHLELARLRRKLEVERERLYLFLMRVPAFIAVTQGPDHRIELSNPLQTSTTGQDMTGRPAREVLLAMDLVGAADLLDQVYRTGEAARVYGFPAKVDRGDGRLTERFFDWVATPLHDDTGQVEGILSFASDVTARVLAQRATDRARGELEQIRVELEEALRREQASRLEAESANRTKDEFLAMLGHELRNPLSPIVTALHLMELRAGADGVFQRERGTIERQVTHLIRLVDDLLDVSRIARGRLELKRRPVEIAAAVANAIELASPLLEARGHKLTVSIPSSGLTVLGDEHRLTQVVTNLLTNAAKYTDPNGKISIRASRRDVEVLLTVRDDGIGIAPEFLPRIFDLFVRRELSQEAPQAGLGLGLAIVRNLVEAHGGTVTAQSPGPGRGSEFTVRLPLHEHSGVEADTPSRGEETPAALLGRRVLVVDDNASAADLAAEALRMAGYNARSIYDGPSAIEEARRFRPALALLDIGMPGMDGYELARQLRLLPNMRRLLLVAITGYGQTIHREKSLEAGFDEHLVKPIAIHDLRFVLRRLFEAHP